MRFSGPKQGRSAVGRARRHRLRANEVTPSGRAGRAVQADQPAISANLRLGPDEVPAREMSLQASAATRPLTRPDVSDRTTEPWRLISSGLLVAKGIGSYMPLAVLA